MCPKFLFEIWMFWYMYNFENHKRGKQVLAKTESVPPVMANGQQSLLYILSGLSIATTLRYLLTVT